ncbi:MAG: tetratricopeptide repeat protein [Theionarchaea archaeon]|nr:tetratricopeptide repeat protein [Theionarchaea archaeon]
MLSDCSQEVPVLYEKALSLYQSVGEKLGEANTYKRLGDYALQAGDFEEARMCYERALEIYQLVGGKDGEASVLIRLCQWAALQDMARYESGLEEGFSLCREAGHYEGLVDAHMVKALLLLKHHNVEEARFELDCSSSILERIHTYCKAVPWLLMYASHLRKHGIKQGAALCLQYAAEFASKAGSNYLQGQVTRQGENQR